MDSEAGLVPRSARLRRILLGYTVNELGTWFGYVALALAVYDHTGSAVATGGLFLARGLLPALLAPVLVARVERMPRRGVLALLYVVEAALALGLAVLLWRFWLAGVLALVAVDGVVAVAATALVRACAARAPLEEGASARPPAPTPAEQSLAVVAGGGEGASSSDGRGPAGPASPPPAAELAQRQANAALNLAFMLCLAVGPAIGGVLVRTLGGPLALVLDAATFLACAGLLAGLQTHVQDGSGDSVRARLAALWQHISDVPQLRALLLTEAVAIVFFASVEPIEVIYAKVTLGTGAEGFGALVAIWGAGAALGALVFARMVHRSLVAMLAGGTLLVGVAYLGFAVAPDFGFACVVAVIGGAGNGVQWPALVSAVQQLTPASMHGRLMSAIGAMAALCPTVGFTIGGAITAVSSPRPTIAVAGAVATLATLAFLRLPLRGLAVQGHAEAAVAPEPGLVSSPR